MRVVSVSPFAAIVLWCLAWLASSAHGQQAALPREVSISTFANTEALVRPMERVITRAYERLGIKVTVERKPIARSLLDADAGLHDAELGRVLETEKEVKHLIRIVEPVGEIRYTPYVLRGAAVPFTNWQTLKQSGLRLGTRFGTRVPEAHLGNALTERPKTQDALLKMLVARHVDVAIGSQTMMRATLADMREAGVPGVGDVVELPPLDRQPLYHYLHQRHAALVKPLNAELKKMHQDGSIQKIWDDSAKEDL